MTKRENPWKIHYKQKVIKQWLQWRKLAENPISKVEAWIWSFDKWNSEQIKWVSIQLPFFKRLQNTVQTVILIKETREIFFFGENNFIKTAGECNHAEEREIFLMFSHTKNERYEIARESISISCEVSKLRHYWVNETVRMRNYVQSTT